MDKRSSTTKPNSNKEAVVHCMHTESTPHGYGLCESCYTDVCHWFDA